MALSHILSHFLSRYSLFIDKRLIKRTIILSIFIGSQVQAQITKSIEGRELPLYEIGGGVVTGVVPAYPASENTNNFYIPFPTFFYRGDILRADEEGGVRGRFLHSKDFELNLSFSGSLPANSKGVAARNGMPDLELIGEVGPGALITIWKKKGLHYYKLGLNIPLRSAWTFEFWKMKEQGLTFNPLLYFITEGLLGKDIFTFIGVSSFWATAKFHKYFYQVDPQYVTATRTAYNAHSGYLGSNIYLGASRNFYKDILIFLGTSYSNYKGAANLASPLFKRSYNLTGVLGFIWWFYESSEKESS